MIKYVLWVCFVFLCCSKKNTPVCRESEILLQGVCTSTCPDGTDDQCSEGFFCHPDKYCAPGKNRSPIIETVDGNGSLNGFTHSDNTLSPYRMYDGLLITGKNLSSVSRALLSSNSSEEIQYDLTETLSFTEDVLTVKIPAELNTFTQLSFKLTLFSPYGKTMAYVDFLRGPQGPVGDRGQDGIDRSQTQGRPGEKGADATCSPQACRGSGFPGALNTFTVIARAAFNLNSFISTFHTPNTLNKTINTTKTNSITVAQYSTTDGSYITDTVYTSSDIDGFFTSMENISNRWIVCVSQGDTSNLLRIRNNTNTSVADILRSYGASDILSTLNSNQTFLFMGQSRASTASALTYTWDNTSIDSEKSALILVTDNKLFGSYTKQESYAKIEQFKGFSIETPSCTNNDITVSLLNNSKMQWNCKTNSIITSEHLQHNAIHTQHWVNAQILSNHIQNNAIDGTVVQSNTLASVSIMDRNILGNHIIANEILGRHIADQTLNSIPFASNSILSNHITNNALNSTHFSTNTLINRNFSSNVIQNHLLSNSAILNRHFGDESISANHIQNTTFGTFTFGSTSLRTSFGNTIGITITTNESRAYTLSNTLILKAPNQQFNAVFSKNADILIIFGHFSFQNLTVNGVFQNSVFTSNSFGNGEIKNSDFANNDAPLQSNMCFLSISACPSGWNHITKNSSLPLAFGTISPGNTVLTQSNITITVSSSTNHLHHMLTRDLNTINTFNEQDTAGTVTFLQTRVEESAGVKELTRRQDDDVVNIVGNWTQAYTGTSLLPPFVVFPSDGAPPIYSPANGNPSFPDNSGIASLIPSGSTYNNSIDNGLRHNTHVLSNTNYTPPTAAFVLCCKP